MTGLSWNIQQLNMLSMYVISLIQFSIIHFKIVYIFILVANIVFSPYLFVRKQHGFYLKNNIYGTSWCSNL
jgi:hypothetical protein